MSDDRPDSRSIKRNCTACGAAALTAARFCGECGTPLARICPSCGALAPQASQNFCMDCGSRLDPPELAGQVPAKRVAGAERRLMTVLFCDIIGSSALAARLDPEELGELLVVYRERCAAAVAQHNGFVSRYVGDGIIACFGYPRAVGRDAQNAVECGLAIGREVASIAHDTVLRGASELAVRIGIETGTVVAGRLGPEGAVELDALVGTAPNVAARLQELAAPNGVVIGEATYELVNAHFDCCELPASRLARLQPPTRAFSIRSSVRQRGGRLNVRRQTDLVGRTTEFRLLCERWELAATGIGQAILLAGEAGIGKSRLAQELLDHLVARGPIRQLVMVCTPRSAQTALYPAIEALRLSLEDEVEDDGSPTRALVAVGEAAGLRGELSLQLLAEALAVGPGPTNLTPLVRRRLLLDALQAWLLSQANDIPLLIIAEDLHWADPSLLELLHNVAQLLPRTNAMLLATCRSDLVPPGLNWPNMLRLSLPTLSRVEAELLLDALPGGRNPESREAILFRSDGIPLFLEEFALAAGASAVPRTLQELFTARLDGLGEAKWLAQCASVLAPHAEPDLLAAVSALPEHLIQHQLVRLVEAKILVASPTPIEAYSFQHALVQQAAIDSLLKAERRTLHAKSAAAVAALRRGLAARHPEIVADHYAAAGDAAAAWPLYALAARRALSSSATEEAEVLVGRGLAALQEAPSLEIPEAELELRVLLGHALIARRGYANTSVQESFERALSAAERVRDEAGTLPPLRGLASFFQVRGPLSRATAICDRLVAASDRSGDVCLRVDAWRRRGWNRLCTGSLREAEVDLTRAVEAFDEGRLQEHIATSGHDPRVQALANLCWLDVMRYGIAAAAARAEVAARVARDSPDAVSTCYGFILPAFVLQQAGQWSEARHLAECALTVANDKGIVYWVALARVAIGHDVAVRRGDPVAGREAIKHGLAGYRETQGELLRPYILCLLSDAEAQLGNIDAAGEALREARAVSEKLEAYGFLPDLFLRESRLPALPGGPNPREALLQALHLARTYGADAIVHAAELGLIDPPKVDAIED
jgi:class 3 adenylate cyclase